MIYSVVMPYYSRPELRFTMDTFIDLYEGRNDIEIVIVEDSKNFNNSDWHANLLYLVTKYKNFFKTKVLLDNKSSYNPASKFNLGVSQSEGPHIILTNPETPHAVNILRSLDIENMDNQYIVCACQSIVLLEDKGSFKNCQFEYKNWYQHTYLCNNKYHYCSLISKKNYNKIGGFDERFCNGIGYEDLNFLKRIEKQGINILTGCDSERIINAVEVATTFVGEWGVPAEYQNMHVSEIVLRILLG